MVDSSAIKRASIYCRIRPPAYDGGGHDMNGDAVAKSLKEWTDTSITLDTQYMFSKGASTYKFPKKVFKPEATQAEVYAEFDPLVQEFTSTPGRNAMILAYGQTGTGKTHTIFGAAEAAVTAEAEEEWGIFPKVVNNTIKTMKAKGAKYIL
jgi:Cdc6-like AAA superfamily ATPase